MRAIILFLYEYNFRNISVIKLDRKIPFTDPNHKIYNFLQRYTFTCAGKDFISIDKNIH